jgi:hypothetical protein
MEPSSHVAGVAVSPETVIKTKFPSNVPKRKFVEKRKSYEMPEKV